ncbi:MAG: hypothetical protein IJZ34_09140 [Lachnospiraceae bacterium]|nr:hypothetical protein [Lachnospiraceae bacterium]
MKKRSFRILIIIIVIVVAAVSAAGVFYLWKRPQLRITQGLLNLTQELAQYENPVLAQAGIDTIWRKMKTGATHSVADVEVTLPEKDNNLLGLKLDKSIDKEQQLLKTTGEISLLEKEILELEVAMEGDDLYVSLPGLSSKAFRMDADRIVSGFNTSLLAKLTGWEISEDYLQMIFGQMTEGMKSTKLEITEPEITELEITDPEGTETKESEQEGLQETGRSVEWASKLTAGVLSIGGEIEEANEESIQSFIKDTDITDLKKTITLEAEHGQIAANGYRIEMPGEPLNRLLSKLQQTLVTETDVSESGANGTESNSSMAAILNYRFGENVTVEMYLDKDNRIVRLETADILADREKQKVELQLDLLGEERTIDIIIGVLLAGQEQQGTEVHFTWNGALVDGGCITDCSVSWKKVENNAALPEEKIVLSSEWSYSGGVFDIEAEYVKENETKACDIQGSLSDVVSGESLRIQVDSMQVFSDDKKVCSLAGSYFVELSKEDITMPTEYVDIDSIFKKGDQLF